MPFYGFSITSLGTGLSENSLVERLLSIASKGDRTRQHFFVRKNGFAIADMDGLQLFFYRT
jgi:hypothetical protein